MCILPLIAPAFKMPMHMPGLHHHCRTGYVVDVLQRSLAVKTRFGRYRLKPERCSQCSFTPQPASYHFCIILKHYVTIVGGVSQDLLCHLCRLQEVNKTWKESPFIHDNRDALSAEVCDLLDLIFVVDPRKRITVPEIMKHSWYGPVSQSIMGDVSSGRNAHTLAWTLSCYAIDPNRGLPVHHTPWLPGVNQKGLSQL